MAKQSDAEFEQQRYSADGHYMIDGARWHYPKTGQPTVCAIGGCLRVLGQQQQGFDLDSLPDVPEGTEPDGADPNEADDHAGVDAA